MGDVYFSQDRPRFFALIVSAVTGQVYLLNDIESMSVQKQDDGSAGSFSITCPLIQEYSIASRATNAAGRINPYAVAAGPMDLVALYGWRQTKPADPSSTLLQSDPVAVLTRALGTPTALLYGDNNAWSVKQLGLPTCMMIGMVDSVRTTKDEGLRATMSIAGRDLTKIFLVNDITVPDAALAAPERSTIGSTFFGLSSLTLSKTKSGPGFLLNALDILVRKDLSSITNLVGAAEYAQYQSFGYPWRNFIRVDALDMSYTPLTQDEKDYPPYVPQIGASWASLLELRNPPMSRMFVNELGQLIYDDQYAAWVTQTPAETIGEEDTREFECGFDDDTLVTFLSIMPGRFMKNIDINAIKGAFLPGTGFVNGIAAAKNASDAHIARYGYRYGQITSTYDVTYEDAESRRKVVLESMNNFWTASITLKGAAYHRVGTRVIVLQDTGRVETSNKTWYVSGIAQQCTFGNDWTTVLTLRYPH